MRERSRARGWALQILYAWEARGPDAASPLGVMREFLGERRVAEESRSYIDWLLRTVEEKRAAIDERLSAALTNWRLERLSAIDRNVLRLGAAELMYRPDVPGRVAIQEAIVLAEKYSTVESPRFVNGVLDAVMRAVRPDDSSGSGRKRGSR